VAGDFFQKSDFFFDNEKECTENLEMRVLACGFFFFNGKKCA
jgi:hypothetical protein